MYDVQCTMYNVQVYVYVYAYVLVYVCIHIYIYVLDVIQRPRNSESVPLRDYSGLVE